MKPARRASQPELQALTHTAIALALLAWTWAPGLTALPATVLTYLAAITGGSKALRWDTARTLAGTNTILRTHAATTIRATAWAITALATAALHALATIHHRTLPATTN
jgi:hypothetical protein